MAYEVPLGFSPAVVTRYAGGSGERESYLVLSPDGRSHWVDDMEAATVFGSMREATSRATRLPAALRAFSLPRARQSATGIQ